DKFITTDYLQQCREHWGVAALALTGLFVLAVTRLLRAFRGGS
ncbi:hypothetical protein ACOB5T_004968, partial [Salmonella enterica subsp. enterica serovar Infantis]|nr:hypothetical protein [Salmonella enterica subsp. enterica serovar Infantis]